MLWSVVNTARKKNPRKYLPFRIFFFFIKKKKWGYFGNRIMLIFVDSLP